jgi:beta-N-acetylhexosaminidase
MRALLTKNPPGGIMLFSYNLKADKETVRSLLAECNAEVADISVPPFFAVDHEGGLVHRFGPGIRRMPSAMSFWWRTQAVPREQALSEVEYYAFHSGQEIRELGINMNFAPVAETLADNNAAFLDTRSYGPDAVFVEQACRAFIRGMGRAGVVCAVKHFPGNADADPHMARPVLAADGGSLDVMIGPFVGLIRAIFDSPAAIMVSHVVVEARDPARNASLSPAVVNGWLRGELGFEGIAIADDFSMGAVASSGIGAAEAAIDSLNAGVDMVMAWPKNLSATHGAILSALKTGRLSRSRLEEAVRRILIEKLRYGLITE